MAKARLKPYDPPSGHLRKRYVSPWGHMYVEGRWYDMDESEPGVTQALAYLKTVRMRNRDVSTPFAFNVCTPEEARQVMIDEERAKLIKVSQPLADDSAPRAPLSVGVREDHSLNQPAPLHELAVPPVPELAPRAMSPDVEDAPVPRRARAARRPAKKKAAAKKKASSRRK
jgi:hypothetical protein